MGKTYNEKKRKQKKTGKIKWKKVSKRDERALADDDLLQHSTGTKTDNHKKKHPRVTGTARQSVPLRCHFKNILVALPKNFA